VEVDVTERLVDALSPILEASGLELVDVVVGGSQVQVVVDRAGGIDLDALAEANREVSRALDELDPLPGRYTLEVSSPGLERRLRTPAHFARAIGEAVTIRTRPDTTEVRRVSGVVTAADENGLALEGPEVPGGSMRIAYDQIERARTLFEWGPAGRPDRPAKSGQGAKQHERERSRS
jgi:ribosome maturation factor RimP